MQKAARTIQYGGDAPHRSQCVTASAYPFEETVARLKAAVEGQEMWLIAEINPQMLLAKGGYEIGGARQILFFHPRYMSRLLAANPAAIVEAPLKMAVMQSPSGGVTVRFPMPGAAFGRYAGMEELALELAGVCDKVAAAITMNGEPPEC